jgi:hypothetical protein
VRNWLDPPPTDYTRSLKVPGMALAPPGAFHPLEWWIDRYYGDESRLTGAQARSALNFGALIKERRGPKGGWWYAVSSDEKWTEWREVWLDRIAGKIAGEARRQLKAG